MQGNESGDEVGLDLLLQSGFLGLVGGMKICFSLLVEFSPPRNIGGAGCCPLLLHCRFPIS